MDPDHEIYSGWAYLIVPASVAVEALAIVAIIRFVRWTRRGSKGAPP